MNLLHIVPGLDDVSNGMSVVARFLMHGDCDAKVIDLSETSDDDIAEADEVWVHGMWLPKEWSVCWRTLRHGARLVRMTHGSLSLVYLKRQGRWKKWLVGPMERYFLRKADRVIATCEVEAEWIRAYEPRVKKIEIVDVKKFFKLEMRDQRWEMRKKGRALHLLYLGRRHPLKGIEFLESAVDDLNHGIHGAHGNVELRIESSVFGEEKEKVWDWCDVLVLPTLSENFGLVVAEALERGKRVVTTDGAPAWGDGNAYGGRLIYLRGYRDGTSEERIQLLKSAIENLCRT